jgi:hypothetical protein
MIFVWHNSPGQTYDPSLLTSLHHTHLAGFLQTSDQLVAEATTYTTHNKHRRQTYTSSAGIKPIIPATERLQTYALDRMATRIYY